MTFPVELRRLKDGGITFAQDTDKERLTKILEIDLLVGKKLEATALGSPFYMEWEDVPAGNSPRCFRDRLHVEIRSRGGNPERGIGYLALEKERVVREDRSWNARPKVVGAKFQVYNIPEEDAQKQRVYISGLAHAWTSK